jgi:uncharacterized protein (DUF885 family)
LTPVFELADRYVSELAALDPIGAAARGVDGHDDELTDYSPAGTAARADLARRTARDLQATPLETDRDRMAANLMLERISAELAMEAVGERGRDLRVIGSPVQGIRQVFDLMSRSTPSDWEVVASRMVKVPAALDGFIQTLRAASAQGNVAARRQALACADQAEAWSGPSPFFNDYVTGRQRTCNRDSARRQLRRPRATHAWPAICATSTRQWPAKWTESAPIGTGSRPKPRWA